MTNTISRALRATGRFWATVSSLVLLGAAFSTANARADEDVVAYAPSTIQQARQAKVGLDEAILAAAVEANAALTRDIRVSLDNAVQMKLTVASAAPSRRG